MMEELPQGNVLYERTTSTGAAQGQMFETKMTAYFLLNLYTKSDDFYLANNFALGEKFDDVVFASLHSKIWKTWFIQLKHVKSLLGVRSFRNKNSDFYLPKYQKSFNIIKKKFHEKSGDIFKHELKDSNFIIFTNAQLNPELSDRERAYLMHDLSTKPGKIFKFNPVLDQDIVSCLEEQDSLCFLDKLMLFTDQASQQEMDLILQKTISKLLNINMNDELAWSVNQKFIEFLNKWFNQANYLTKANITKILNELELDIKSDKKSEMKIEFLPNFLKQFIFKPDSQIIVVTCKGLTIVCQFALKQALVNKKCTWLDLSKLSEKPTDLMTWFQSDKDVLIIDCDTDETGLNMEGFINILKNLNLKKTKYVIILVPINNTFGALITERISVQKITFNCTLNNFSDLTKKNLMSKEILFQGFKVKISDLFGDEKFLQDVFNMEMVTDLISNHTVSVGVKPIETIPYYISRIMQKPLLNLHCLKSITTKDNLLIFNSNVEEIKNLSNTQVKIVTPQELDYQFFNTPVIVVTATKNDEVVKSVGEKFRPKTVVVVEKVKNDFQFCFCLGDMINLSSRHIAKKKFTFQSSDEIILNKNNKVVLISAEPGMGKSTLMSHIAAVTKQKYPDLWVVMIPLNDLTDNFDNKTSFSTTDEVKNIISKAAGVSSNTSRFDTKLFEYCYKNGKMVILLDGFDEVSSFYEKEALFTINTLKKMNFEKLWVTTRPVNKNLLEQELSEVSWTIKPFEEKEQKSFLTKYWKYKFNNISNDTLNTFVQKTISLANKSFDNEQIVFIGVPLQTRMLAEAYNEHIQHHQETGVVLPVETINLLQLFHKFVRIKFQINITEKAKINVNLKAVHFDIESVNQVRKNELMKLAILHLFQLKDVMKIKPCITQQEIDYLKGRVNNGFETTGFVVKYVNTPEFIHKTFAEYFAALFFSQYLIENQAFIQNFIYDKSYSFVRYMFERMLVPSETELPLHWNILNNVKIEKFDKDKINVCDRAGRTPLHLSCMSKSNEHLVEMLIKSGANVDTVDLFGFLPIQYANNSLSWLSIGYILEIRPEQKMRLTNVTKDNFEWALYKLCFQNDFLQLFKYLVNDLKINLLDPNETTKDVLLPLEWLPNETITTVGLTDFHLAGAYGAIKILEYKLSNFYVVPLQVRYSFMKLLINELMDDQGRTLLHLACLNNREEMIKYLCKNQADITRLDSKHKTSLYYVVLNKNVTILQVFLDLLSSQKNPETFDMLRQAFMLAVKGKVDHDETIVKLLLKFEPRLIECTDQTSNTPVMIAVKHGTEKMLRTLLDHGAVINKANIKGYTALHFAVGRKEADFMKIILSSGADVNCVTNTGSTPLHLAVKTDNKQLVTLMFLYNPDVNLVDQNKNTALHYAAIFNESKEIADELINMSIDVNAVNKEGLTYHDIIQLNEAKKNANIKEQNVQKQSVKKQNVQKQNVKEQNIKEQNVQKQNVQKQNVKEQNIKEQNVQKQNVKEQNIKEQNVKPVTNKQKKQRTKKKREDEITVTR